MEAGLKKLDAQERKYATELDNALGEYAELKEQAVKFDPDELLDARLALRPDMERSAVSRVQSAYGKHYDIFRMYDSKRDVSNLLNEDAELRAAEERRWRRQKLREQPRHQKKSRRQEQER